MTVILPQETTTQIGMAGAATQEDPPVLYLLHGLSDDHTIWLRRTSIERYVAPLGLAVVMPQVHRSFYADEALGGAYWTFLTAELPALVHRFFRLSDRREDTFVAGLSMGGYGAFKWALRQPERFAAAASLSGALHVSGLRASGVREEDPNLFPRIFGHRDPTGSQDDLLALVNSVDVEKVPPLRLWCGTEDPLYDDNVMFAEVCNQAGVPIETTFGPGAHDWGYWDDCIQDVLEWLPLRGPGG
jgi:S-formylglutathione hydrolase FrmB